MLCEHALWKGVVGCEDGRKLAQKMKSDRSDDIQAQVKTFSLLMTKLKMQQKEKKQQNNKILTTVVGETGWIRCFANFVPLTIWGEPFFGA